VILWGRPSVGTGVYWPKICNILRLELCPGRIRHHRKKYSQKPGSCIEALEEIALLVKAMLLYRKLKVVGYGISACRHPRELGVLHLEVRVCLAFMSGLRETKHTFLQLSVSCHRRRMMGASHSEICRVGMLGNGGCGWLVDPTF